LGRVGGNNLVAKKKSMPVHKFGAFSKMNFDACAAKLGTRRVATVSKELSALWKTLDEHEQEEYAVYAEKMNLEKYEKEQNSSQTARNSMKGRQDIDLIKTVEQPSKRAKSSRKRHQD
jgi:HMG (high mobility group) box